MSRFYPENGRKETTEIKRRRRGFKGRPAEPDRSGQNPERTKASEDEGTDIQLDFAGSVVSVHK